MNALAFIRQLILFAEAASIDSQDYKYLFILRIICSFIHIDKVRVTDTVLKCWTGVGENENRVQAEDISWCCCVLCLSLWVRWF
jgi:hypothetical protein